MNKTTQTALLGVMSLAAIGATQAEVSPYVGVELSAMSVDYDNGLDVILADNFKAVNPYVGFQINENFAIETGYLQTNSQGKSASGTINGTAVTADTNLKIKGFHIDAVGRKNISDKFDLLGSVGIARLKANLDINVTAGSLTAAASGNDSDTALRLGAGGEYALTDNVSLRGMARYMKVDFSNVSKNLTSVGIGLNYKF